MIIFLFFVVKMPIDKSWIHLKNQLSNQYWDGLCAFIDFAKELADDDGCISFPCRNCLNHEMLRIETVRAHIH